MANQISSQTKVRLTSELIPDITLTHGRTIWVMQSLGFSQGVSEETFREYIKSIRKLGVPFARGNPGLNSGRLASYSYNHLMELSLALRLRTYGILPDPVTSGLIRFRHDLYNFYRRAYLECDSHLGAPIGITTDRQPIFVMSGVYIDLRLHYVRGNSLQFGPPRLISPFEALRVFAETDAASRAHVPFNLSALAIRVVGCAMYCLEYVRRRSPQVPPLPVPEYEVR